MIGNAGGQDTPRRRLWFGSLESRFYLIFTIIFFASILGIQIVSFRFTVSAVRNATIQTKATLLDQLVERINTYIAGMERISRAVTSDPNVRLYLRGATASSGGGLAGNDRLASEQRLVSDIQGLLAHYIQARQDISSILVLRSDGLAVSGDRHLQLASWAEYQKRPWFVDTIAANGRTVVSGSYVQDLMAGRYSWVVSLSRQIPGEDGGEPLGTLLVDLKFNQIRELCESLVVGDNGYTFILDDHDRYVFHPAQQLVYSGIRDEPLDRIADWSADAETPGFQDGELHYLIAQSAPTGWRVISVSDDSDLATGWEYVQVTYAVIGLVVFVVLGFITNFISQGITRPVHQLAEVMRSVETGEFKEAGQIKATDEIRELAREYDIMVSRIRDLMAANAREQELKRMSDLRALQAQINPHFLYNTLDSIVWMAEMNRSREVVTMTAALSRLFRISISRGRELVRLRDELDHVRNYLTIQKMRYEDRLHYEVDVDEELLDLTVLKIILQPLVENAIYHGVRNISYPGLIEIGGSADGDVLRLWVRDNGAGMEPAELEALIRHINESPADQLDSTPSGVGVRNVNERLQLYFGTDYGLDIESEPESGTTICCRLPVAQWTE
jgi:two-component system, sensor histidine kinase YesM